MGMAYLQGQLDIPQNPNLAIPLLKQAADIADVECPQAAYVFGMILLGAYDYIEIPPITLIRYLPRPSPTNTDPRTTEARRYLERAAYLGYGPAQTKVGWAHEFAKMGCPYDPLISVQYYCLASQQGEEEADMALSKWFLCGAEGYFDKDETVAFTFAEKAARKGLLTAEFAMGYYFEIGVGNRNNLDLAVRWYQKVGLQIPRSGISRV
jgi:TPR repeat protein